MGLFQRLKKSASKAGIYPEPTNCPTPQDLGYSQVKSKLSPHIIEAVPGQNGHLPDWFLEFVDAFPIFGHDEAPFLAGGCVRRAVQREQVTRAVGDPFPWDFDIWFNSEEQFNTFTLWFVDQGAVVESEKGHCTNLKFVSEGWKIQLHRIQWFNSLPQLFDYFDYSICQFAFGNRERLVLYSNGSWNTIFHHDLPENCIYWNKSSWNDLQGKQLVANNLDKNPLNSFWRIQKYYDQGFRFSETTAKDFMKSYLTQVSKGQSPYIDLDENQFPVSAMMGS